MVRFEVDLKFEESYLWEEQQSIWTQFLYPTWKEIKDYGGFPHILMQPEPETLIWNSPVP